MTDDDARDWLITGVFASLAVYNAYHVAFATPPSVMKVAHLALAAVLAVLVYIRWQTRHRTAPWERDTTATSMSVNVSGKARATIGVPDGDTDSDDEQEATDASDPDSRLAALIVEKRGVDRAFAEQLVEEYSRDELVGQRDDDADQWAGGVLTPAEYEEFTERRKQWDADTASAADDTDTPTIGTPDGVTVTADRPKPHTNQTTGDGTLMWSVSASGDGTTAKFTVEHRLGNKPTGLQVQATSKDARGEFFITRIDDTTFDIVYATPPPSGRNNLSWGVAHDASAVKGTPLLDTETQTEPND